MHVRRSTHSKRGGQTGLPRRKHFWPAGQVRLVCQTECASSSGRWLRLVASPSRTQALRSNMLAIRRCAGRFGSGRAFSAELRLACSCPSPSVGCLSRADQNGEVGFAPPLNRSCKAQRREQRGDRQDPHRARVSAKLQLRRERDRQFESALLQRRVQCELTSISGPGWHRTPLPARLDPSRLAVLTASPIAVIEAALP
jgi:hypothetical protein